MELTGLGTISDTLVYRRRWGSPAVLRERNMLLGGDRVAAYKYIKQWRKKAVPMVLRLYKEMIDEEKCIFGDKSFYHHLELSYTNGTPIPVIEPDADMLDKEVVRAASEEGLLFAEEVMSSQGATGFGGGPI
jgi:hypothetical protein